MSRLQGASALLALLLALGVFVARRQVQLTQRSRPGADGFAMSHRDGYGQRCVPPPAPLMLHYDGSAPLVKPPHSTRCRGYVQQRWGLSADGLPQQILRFKMAANDSMPGAYQGHASSPPPHIHNTQVFIRPSATVPKTEGLCIPCNASHAIVKQEGQSTCSSCLQLISLPPQISYDRQTSQMLPAG